MGVGAGHSQSVGGVAWCGDNIVTISADTTLKLAWEGELVSIRTEINYDKDINW